MTVKARAVEKIAIAMAGKCVTGMDFVFLEIGILALYMDAMERNVETLVCRETLWVLVMQMGSVITNHPLLIVVISLKFILPYFNNLRHIFRFKNFGHYVFLSFIFFVSILQIRLSKCVPQRR